MLRVLQFIWSAVCLMSLLLLLGVLVLWATAIGGKTVAVEYAKGTRYVLARSDPSGLSARIVDGWPGPDTFGGVAKDKGYVLAPSPQQVPWEIVWGTTGTTGAARVYVDASGHALLAEAAVVKDMRGNEPFVMATIRTTPPASHFMTAFLVSVPLQVWIWRRMRRRWQLEERARDGRCLACGYDLRETADRCPECGAVTSSGIQ